MIFRLYSLFVFFLFSIKAFSISDLESTLSALQGADMIVYELYSESKQAGNEKSKIQYAEIFINQIDVIEPLLDTTIIVGMLNEIINFHETKSYKFSKAIEYKQKLLDLYKMHGFSYLHSVCQYQLAQLYFKVGLYHKALELSNSSLSYFTKNTDLFHLNNINNVLGVMYSLCDDFEKSEYFFKKALNGAKKIGNSSQEIVILNNKAVFSIKRGEYEKTEKILEHTLNLSEQFKDTASNFSVYMNLIMLYIDSGRYEEARKLLSKSYKIMKSIPEKGLYFYNYGIVMESMNKIDSAIKSYRLSIDYYNKGEFCVNK